MIKTIYQKLKNMPVMGKAAIAYTLASVFTQGVSFITTPIFTRIMSTSEIGLVATYAAWLSIITVIANFSLGSGSFSIAMNEFKHDRDGYISSILTLSCLFSILTSAALFGLSNLLLPIMGIPLGFLYLMMFNFILGPAQGFWLLKQRYEYKYKASVFVSVGTSLLATTFAVISVIYFDEKVAHVDLASVRLFASNSIILGVSVFFFIYIYIKGKKVFSKKYWAFALTINTPLLIHALAKNILDVSDRTMISNMIGTSEVGKYSVLYSVSSVSLIIWSAINSSLVPYMFDKLKLGEKGSNDINRIVNIMILIYAVTCLSLTLVAPELVQILATDEYLETVYIMPPVAAGIFLTSLYSIFGNVLLYHKKTKSIMYATLLAAAFNLIGNFIAIPLFGYIAAAYTTLGSYIILAIFQFIAMKKIHRGKLFNDKLIWIIALVVIIAGNLTNLVYEETLIRYIIVIIIILSAILFRNKIWKTIQIMKEKNN